MNIQDFRKPFGTRYGIDACSLLLLILWFLLDLLIPTTGVWKFIGIVVVNGTLFFNIYRSLSTNIAAREKENEICCSLFQSAKEWFLRVSTPKSPKVQVQPGMQYKTFSCPGCHHKMRAPKGKGKIKVTCHSCGKEFVKKV